MEGNQKIEEQSKTEADCSSEAEEGEVSGEQQSARGVLEIPIEKNEEESKTEDDCSSEAEGKCLEKKEEGEVSGEQQSPRGVLEIPISENGSSTIRDRSSSFGSASGDESTVEREGGGLFGEGNGFQWKGLLDKIKKRSIRQFSIIPLLVGNHASTKNLRRKLGRIRSADENIDCGDIDAPKPSWRSFSYEELAEATDNFSPDKLIGKGGHAEVYKGCLSDGEVVAVKKITKKEKNDEDRVSDFLSELGIIAHINHPNAAKLIGFSTDRGFHLVLQFSPHGSLASVLHGGSAESLEWKIRYKVVIGVAQGLNYLHYQCQRRIIHRDITASNILLTEDYEPQISDFGLAKWLPEKWLHHVVSPIEGTFGYMAPEYFMHGIVHEKTDVFAFGVLILELITGRCAVDSSRQSLVMWAKPLLEKNDIKELADARLGENYNVVEVKRALFTASVCLHHLPSMRPTMNKVIQLLRGENDPLDMKQKSMEGRSILLDASDLEVYSCTTYLKDLNRHMQLVME